MLKLAKTLQNTQKTAKFGLFAVAFTGVSALATTNASACGDQCADLEERVAELEATTVRKGNRKVSLTVYGSVESRFSYEEPISDEFLTYDPVFFNTPSSDQAPTDGDPGDGHNCADLEERVAELEATTVRKGNQTVSLKLSGCDSLDERIGYLEDDTIRDSGRMYLHVPTGAWVNADSFDQFGAGIGTLVGRIDPSAVGYHLSSGNFLNEPYVTDNPWGPGNFVTKFHGSANGGVTDVNTVDPAADNTTWGTRGWSLQLGATGAGAWGDNYDTFAGFTVVGEAAFNNAYWDNPNVNWGCDQTDENPNFCLSKANVWVASKEFGKIEIGRITSAAFGAGGVNLGGTHNIWTQDIRSINGNNEFPVLGRTYHDMSVNKTGKPHATGAKWISPTVAGFSLSTSFDEDDYWDVALRYAGEFGRIRVAAGVAYFENPVQQQNNESEEAIQGSASIAHTPTGLYVAGGFGNYEINNNNVLGVNEVRDSDSWHVTAGINHKWASLGKTNIWGMYSNSDDSARGGAGFINGSGTDSWGVGINQQISEAAMELYLFYTHTDAKVNNLEDDFDVVVGGARIKF